MSAEVEARGLVVRRGAFTLGPVDLAVGHGEYLVLVGPSGAGKTMLVETLLGWHAADAGEAILAGVPIEDLAPPARRVAYLPQDLGLLPHLSVRANLTWGLRCRGERVDPGLESRVVGVLGLGEALARRDPTTLSRGEQQRVGIGRALLTRPHRLVLDEPCAALDPHLRRELQLLLRSLHREFAMTVIHVTHDREEAFVLGERIAVLLAGRLHQVATPAELYARPADLAVARFLAPENLWPCAVRAGEHGFLVARPEDAPVDLLLEVPSPVAVSETPGTPLPRAALSELRASVSSSPRGSAAFVGIRPEEVMLLDPDRPLRPQVARNVLAGTIEELLFLDGRVQLVVGTEPGLTVTVRAPVCSVEDRGLAAGCNVRVSLKARSLYLVCDGPV
jgi:ABC-type Fe3+/spermidine/putrescine transport system ATPase subunit